VAKVNTEHFNLVADGDLMIEELLQLWILDPVIGFSRKEI